MDKILTYILIGFFTLTPWGQKVGASELAQSESLTELCAVYKSPFPENGTRVVRCSDEGLRAKLHYLPWATVATFGTLVTRKVCEAYLSTASNVFWRPVAQLVVDYVTDSKNLAIAGAGLIDLFRLYFLPDLTKPSHLTVDIIETVKGQKPVISRFKLTSKEAEAFKEMRSAHDQQILKEGCEVIAALQRDVVAAVTQLQQKYQDLDPKKLEEIMHGKQVQ